MATRLELWEPCLECENRKLEKIYTINHDIFNCPVSDWFDSCIHAPVCKRIDGLEMIGKERDA